MDLKYGLQKSEKLINNTYPITMSFEKKKVIIKNNYNK